jgi:hypothetical protein
MTIAIPVPITWVVNNDLSFALPFTGYDVSIDLGSEKACNIRISLKVKIRE